jgi:hypothetical protein
MSWEDVISIKKAGWPSGRTHGYSVDSNIIRKILEELGFPKRGEDGIVSREHWNVDRDWDITHDEQNFKVVLNLKEEGDDGYILEAIPKGEMKLIQKSYESDDVKVVKVFKNFKMKEVSNIPIGERFRIKWNGTHSIEIVDYENGVLVLSIIKK